MEKIRKARGKTPRRQGKSFQKEEKKWPTASNVMGGFKQMRTVLANVSLGE